MKKSAGGEGGGVVPWSGGVHRFLLRFMEVVVRCDSSRLCQLFALAGAMWVDVDV